jgi:hypothetical protein
MGNALVSNCGLKSLTERYRAEIETIIMPGKPGLREVQECK